MPGCRIIIAKKNFLQRPNKDNISIWVVFTCCPSFPIQGQASRWQQSFRPAQDSYAIVLITRFSMSGKCASCWDKVWCKWWSMEGLKNMGYLLEIPLTPTRNNLDNLWMFPGHSLEHILTPPWNDLDIPWKDLWHRDTPFTTGLGTAKLKRRLSERWGLNFVISRAFFCPNFSTPMTTLVTLAQAVHLAQYGIPIYNFRQIPTPGFCCRQI